ncbi:MAG: 2-succinyl-5-enolpyruvyl-6-hydroxy-3-cyclohexene-1-carboxylic-acid synthase [Alicyclobacillus herbarius]|uniref:2-succinyl-5-enolpyruvyl-6-hydroxy-3- cyclohexene-1-carboxylic-acid synthase n=1 Tax=Alicyclobacillus herbarius TaxID=122960 RepID=UPI0023568613|nr:2-succinyl-5-enolpyruvyl-6-hydroxy-3-cyclohexene-1-carboxylic-acid synthase [Alicyclobacillus herbarius]MCL6633305.1 2-succinyl-5-enolpyruvyl-6-hydroxy-3-cyclohexene-1-carboxylic-acid synthase [Alicyclobacillus herbarius]
MSGINPALSVLYEFMLALSDAGLRHVVISPGSRSTPLTMSVVRCGRFQVWSQLDERSAGFFAVGIARASAEPVALICTSGTAAGNYLPAVMEAHTACLPLLVLTADRPPELHDVGSNQTVRQSGMYGPFVKWQHDLAVPDDNDTLRRYLADTARRAVLAAVSLPRGPVHLNVPLREPLIPPAWDEFTCGRSPIVRAQVFPSQRLPHPAALEDMAKWLRESQRPLLVLGPMERPWNVAALCQFAKAQKIPVLADPLSQVRTASGETTICHYDVFLRDDTIATALDADFVLRMGQTPTSKSLGRYLTRHANTNSVVIDESPVWRDPFFTGAMAIETDVDPFVQALLEHTAAGDEAVPTRVSWLNAWRTLDAACGDTLFRAIESQWQEASALLGLVAAVPDGSTVVVGNSMPIRDLDAFFRGGDKSIRFLANRGVSGIDGVVSTAVGAAAAGKGMTALCIGDVSFYHDLNGLLAVGRHRLDLFVLVIHNDGGGIFSFLPQAGHLDTFEHFRTPHGLDFAEAVRMYGGHWDTVDNPEALREAVARHLRQGGLTVVEARFDADENHRVHEDAITAAVTKARTVAAALGMYPREGGGV